MDSGFQYLISVATTGRDSMTNLVQSGRALQSSMQGATDATRALSNSGLQAANPLQRAANTNGLLVNSAGRLVSINTQLVQSNRVVVDSAGRARDAMERFISTGNGLESVVAKASSLGGVLGGLTIGATVKHVATAKMDDESRVNSIKFASGADAENNLSFLKKTITDLNMPIEAAQSGFKTLAGSVMGTGITTAQTQAVFLATAKASRVMGLDAEQTKGSLLALGQMASKGKVSAEELRGQLGERLPGAFSIAARAMGVTTGELDKILKDGELLATDFLPKFAVEMEKTFSAGVPAAMSTARAASDAFQNKLYELNVALGESLMPSLIALGNGLLPIITTITRNTDAVFALASAGAIWYGVTKTAFFWNGLWNLSLLASRNYLLGGGGAMGVYTAIQMGVTGATGLLTSATMALNAAFWANPIGFVIGILGVLAVSIYYAWQKFEGFRGGLYVTWGFMKTFGSIVFDFIITPLSAATEALIGFLTLDSKMMSRGGNRLADWAKNTDFNVGNRFEKGIYESVSDANASWKTDDPKEKTGANSIFASATPKPAADGAAKAVKKTGDGITGGGHQTRIINISIAKMGVDNLSVSTTNLSGGINEMRDIIMRDLVRAVNSANQIQ